MEVILVYYTAIFEIDFLRKSILMIHYYLKFNTSFCKIGEECSMIKGYERPIIE